MFSWFDQAEAECLMSYPSIVKIDYKFSLLEKQQQLNCFYNMEVPVHPLFEASMAQNSLLLISLMCISDNRTGKYYQM